MRVKVTNPFMPVINYDVLPVGEIDHAIIISDRELAMIRMWIDPFMLNSQAVMHQADTVFWDTLSDVELSDTQEEVEQLIDKLGGQAPMDVEKMMAGWYANYTPFVDAKYDLNLPAGTASLNSTVVPAGQLWNVTAFHMRMVSSTITTMYAQIINGGSGMRPYQIATPVSGVYYTYSGSLWLKAGDYMQCWVLAATLNDDLYLGLHGTKLPTV